MKPNPMYEAAMAYAELGWRTLLVKPKTKLPFFSAWNRKATTNPKEIKLWWSKWAGYNIGILTGSEVEPGRYLVAVDIDPGNGGELSLEFLEEEHGPLPDTVVCHTGGGGRHYYFTSARPLPNRTGLLPGIDIRGEGGFVVAPPSVHKNGSLYAWELSSLPGETAVAEIPGWLEEGIVEKSLTLASALSEAPPVVGEQRAAPHRHQVKR